MLILQLAAGYHVFTFAELAKDSICFHGFFHFLEAEVRRPTLVLDSFDSIFFCLIKHRLTLARPQ